MRIISYLRDVFFVAAGICSATIGLKGFLLPNGFLDGGITGVSLLANFMTGGHIATFIIVFNMPFIWLGARQISTEFAVKTLFAILALSAMLVVVDMPSITNDKLLTAVFGGIFLGAGIGLCVRGGAVIDGTEALALYCSRRFGIAVGDVIIILNVTIFSAAALLVNIETAMYSMLTYAAASKAVDFLISGIEEYIGLTIISERSGEIHDALMHKLGKAVTVYKGGAGYMSDAERQILFCIITRLEVSKIESEITQLDPSAFITQQTINHVRGGMVKKRPLHD
ncbi:MAG: YitT family protein [Bacteroidetes bacterium]|nr:YitT family protein [Bacteroidota bacterium]